MSDPSIAAERVGRYQLLEPIGVGPNGSVARAKVFGVAGLERQFAIKRFHPELTVLAPMAQAISAAARAYNGLEHPRIARMNELGVAGGETFIAVEYVPGLDALRLAIEARAAGTILPVGGSLQLVSSAARAVGYAHGRGLCHLGLSPTNVLVTVEGDVKVSDFGLLAATIGAQPTEQPRLERRIAYLAPEQLAGEDTSTATDVYALGVIAYELVTGQPAFAGGNAAEVARAVLAGPPPEPPLPRPIVRVLQRCLARSPFERFPDARALADALDAALRVAPVPGTRRDVGAQVKASLDRLAALNEGNLSGMLSLPLGPGPSDEVSTTDFVRPDVPVPGPAPLVGPRDVAAASTVPELARPMTTMAGVAPPPIPGPGPSSVGPVPRGVASGSSPPAPPATPAGAGTILGITGVKRAASSSQIPPIPRPKPPTDPKATLARPPGSATPPPLPAVPPGPVAPPASAAAPRPAAALRPAAAPAHDRSETIPDPRSSSESEVHDAARTGPRLYEVSTSEMPPLLKTSLANATTRPTEEVDALVAQAYATDPEVGFPDERHAGKRPPAHDLAPPPAAGSLPAAPPAYDPPMPAYDPPMPAYDPSMPGPMPPAPGPMPPAPGPMPPAPAFGASFPAQSPARWPKVALGVVAVAALGGAGYFGYRALGSHPSSGGAVAAKAPGSGTTGAGSSATGRVATSPGAGSAVAAVEHAAAATVPAGSAVAEGSAAGSAGSAAAAAAGSAGTAAAGSAGTAAAGSATTVAEQPPPPAAGSDDDTGANPTRVTPPTATPTAGSDALEIVSKPAGARVYLDGSDVGATPLKMPSSGDQHTLALYLPGHALYLRSIAGHGRYEMSLDAAPFPRGEAGLKVIDCKDEHRYYVFLDGQPTGRTCPSGRIHLALGKHTIEIYDLVTETRRTWTIDANETRTSYRIKVE